MTILLVTQVLNKGSITGDKVSLFATTCSITGDKVFLFATASSPTLWLAHGAE